MKLNYLVGFYGAGSHAAYGNVWFETLAHWIELHAGTRVRLYSQAHGARALRELLAELDADKTGRVTERELDRVKIGVLGYSWGAIAAMRFAHRLSQRGEFAASGRRISLHAPVTIENLFAIDPVCLMQWPVVVPETVRQFTNYYQVRGGNSNFAALENKTEIVSVGNWFSRRLKGSAIRSRAKDTLQVDTGANEMTVDGVPFYTESNRYRLLAQQTGHDAMPWLVAPEIMRALCIEMN